MSCFPPWWQQSGKLSCVQQTMWPMSLHQDGGEVAVRSCCLLAVDTTGEEADVTLFDFDPSQSQPRSLAELQRLTGETDIAQVTAHLAAGTDHDMAYIAAPYQEKVIIGGVVLHRESTDVPLLGRYFPIVRA